MPRTGLLYVAALWAVGLATGIVQARAPEALPLPAPALLVPLAVSLVLDLALQALARSGRAAPLTTGERGIGVIGAGIIAVAVSFLLAR